MKHGKRPGKTGFTAEFFTTFWRQFGHFVLRSLNYGYKTGEPAVTQRQGIITCIPKENNSEQYLKNWRPLTLLDIVYKKVQVGKDQEKAQSEKDSHSKNQAGKKPN